MPLISDALVPLINAADSLTEQARDLLRLHRQEMPRSFSIIATLEAAMDALDEAQGPDLQALALVLGWLDSPAMERTLTQLLGRPAARASHIQRRSANCRRAGFRR